MAASPVMMDPEGQAYDALEMGAPPPLAPLADPDHVGSPVCPLTMLAHIQSKPKTTNAKGA